MHVRSSRGAYSPLANSLFVTLCGPINGISIRVTGIRCNLTFKRRNADIDYISLYYNLRNSFSVQSNLRYEFKKLFRNRRNLICIFLNFDIPVSSQSAVRTDLINDSSRINITIKGNAAVHLTTGWTARGSNGTRSSRKLPGVVGQACHAVNICST